MESSGDACAVETVALRNLNEEVIVQDTSRLKVSYLVGSQSAEKLDEYLAGGSL